MHQEREQTKKGSRKKGTQPWRKVETHPQEEGDSRNLPQAPGTEDMQPRWRQQKAQMRDEGQMTVCACAYTRSTVSRLT